MKTYSPCDYATLPEPTSIPESNILGWMVLGALIVIIIAMIVRHFTFKKEMS